MNIGEIVVVHCIGHKKSLVVSDKIVPLLPSHVSKQQILVGGQAGSSSALSEPFFRMTGATQSPQVDGWWDRIGTKQVVTATSFDHDSLLSFVLNTHCCHPLFEK